MSKAMSAIDTFAESSLRQKVTDWLMVEAELLDDQRERDWLNNLVSKEVEYQVPLRQTVGRGEGKGFVPGAYHLVESWGSLNSKPGQIQSHPASPRRAGHRCGMTVVMRRWMTGRKPSQQTGTWRRNRHRTLRSISASVGE